MSLRSKELIDSQRVDLRALRAVVAVADEGSFRQAGDLLGYTQSAISHQVATLERSLGHQFFHRPGGRGKVALTQAGQAVYRRARRALSEVDALEADLAQTGHERAVIRVGVTQTMAAEVMPAALRAFREVHPDVGVVLSDVTEGEAVLNAVARGRIDLALATDPEPDERIVAIPIIDDPFVILTRRDSALAASDDPAFALLDGQEVVAWTRRWRYQTDLEEAWVRLGIAPKIVYRTDDNLALQRLVAAGLGHACIGMLTARHAVEPSLTWLSPREQVRFRRYHLCYSSQRPLTPALSALVAAIRSQSSA
ncbi:MAG: LysR family transcriptional regulator [Acidimicrobiales bacterium]|jgi:DNA-binding transcriptional LysR family regulator